MRSVGPLPKAAEFTQTMQTRLEKRLRSDIRQATVVRVKMPRTTSWGPTATLPLSPRPL